MSISETVANSELHDRTLPPPGADWMEIVPFAYTFDGYEHWALGGICALIANTAEGKSSELADLSLNELRTCLFFEGRRFNHFGWDPPPVILSYIRDLVERIRTKVDAGITDGRDDPSPFRPHYEGAMADEIFTKLAEVMSQNEIAIVRAEGGHVLQVYDEARAARPTDDLVEQAFLDALADAVRRTYDIGPGSPQRR